ncbi:hypothetical protein BY996DRAFT_6431883 [Phakopsora pachyrhizi]|nr:hypothetical protein BY996DRAFT_6431883 [Phakopsora pachyrhizi]
MADLRSTFNRSASDNFLNSSCNKNSGNLNRLSQQSQPTPSSSSSPTNKQEPQQQQQQTNIDKAFAHQLVDQIINDSDLYSILGLKCLNRCFQSYSPQSSIKFEDIRKAYITRSRICHPDKLPHHPNCTAAFQKLSYAYETLSKPSSRRLYDLNGHTKNLFAFQNNQHQTSRPAPAFTSFENFRNPNRNKDKASQGDEKENQDANRSSSNSKESNGTGNGFNNSDETLNGVLYSTFCEFMDGDFEMIRVLINALNEGNPGLNLGEESIRNLETSFKKLRTIFKKGQKYIKLVRFELMNLYELQSDLRSMSYFNLFGRLRLTMAIARVTISIPMRIDQVFKQDDEDESRSTTTTKDDSESSKESSEQKERKKNEKEQEKEDDETADKESEEGEQSCKRVGLLPGPILGLLEATVAVLEKGEKVTLWISPSYPSSSTTAASAKETTHPEPSSGRFDKPSSSKIPLSSTTNGSTNSTSTDS